MKVLDGDDKLSEGEQQDVNIFVLPRVKTGGTGLNILALADGNNRANGVNKGYDAGGTAVVKMAEYAAIRGDIAKLVACIVSFDNAEKRGDEFFFKLYQAFLALGLKIDNNGVLVNKGITMSVHGDLGGLSKKSIVTRDFVDMVRAVCTRTHNVDNPTMELVFGINYDERIALENDVDIAFRSGMEELDVMRLSGLKVHSGMVSYASSVLWPNITTDEFGSYIDRFKESHDKRFSSGYDERELELLCRRLNGDIEVHKKVFFPMRSRVAKPFYNEIVLPVDSDKLYVLNETDFAAFIAPGQKDFSEYVIPEFPDLKYANVHISGSSIEEIADSVDRAICFDKKYEHLKGSQRPIVVVSKEDVGFDDLKDYNYLLSKRGFKESDNFELIEQLSNEQLANENEQTRYFAVMELFVSNLLRQKAKVNTSMESAIENVSVVGYLITSFFLTYFPNHPSWNEVNKEWFSRSEALAKYMLSLFYLDDIFDSFIDKCKVGDRNFIALCKYLDYFKMNFKMSWVSPDLKMGSLDDIERSIDSCIGWLKEIYADSVALFPNNVKVRDRWFKHMSKFVSSTLNEAKPVFSELPLVGANSVECVRKNLYEYLNSIEASMGAGQAYWTIAMFTPDADNEKVLEILDSITLNSNYYYRLLNDCSGRFSRDFNDQEKKYDAIEICREISDGMDEAYKLLDAISFAKREIDNLERKISSDIVELGKYNKSLAISVQRAIIAKDIYSNSHYRTTTFNDLKSLIVKRFDTGVKL